MRHRQEHTNPRLQRDKVFALMQILQVVMNTSKLEPIADKNVAAYFHDLDVNCHAKLLCYFKKIHFTPNLCLSILNTFVKTKSHGRRIVEFFRFLNIPMIYRESKLIIS